MSSKRNRQRKIYLGHTSSGIFCLGLIFSIYRNFPRSFSKKLYVVTALQINILLLKLDIRKHAAAVSVNKESINKSNSKNVFHRF